MWSFETKHTCSCSSHLVFWAPLVPFNVICSFISTSYFQPNLFSSQYMLTQYSLQLHFNCLFSPALFLQQHLHFLPKLLLSTPHVSYHILSNVTVSCLCTLSNWKRIVKYPWLPMISPCANIQYVTKTNLLLQNPPGASVKLLKTKVFVCSKQTKQQLSQTNTTRSILPSFGDSQHKDVEIINNYPPEVEVTSSGYLPSLGAVR